MKRFVEGADRVQSMLLPACLDDWIDEENPVRAVDVFVEARDLKELGFDGVEPAATGRPAFHPSVLLKLYTYGYLDRVQSSRRLECEAADLQEATEALAAKSKHLKEKLAKLEREMQPLEAYEKQRRASPDQQISLTDPDSRSMATSGRGSGVVGYNVQVAVETENHLIITHEVTNSGSDRSQLADRQGGKRSPSG